MSKKSRTKIINRFADSFPERPKITQKIIQLNRKKFMEEITIPSKFVDIKVQFQIPQIYAQNFAFENFISRIPKPPQQATNKPSFPFYHRTFRFIYFLIGEKDSPTWKRFQNLYEKIIPENHRPLHNIGEITKKKQMMSDLNCFIDSGMQVRLLINSKDERQLKDIYSQIKLIESKSQVIEIIVQRVERLVRPPSNKLRIVFNINELLMQDQQIQRLIKKSTKNRDTIQYNFVNLQANSTEAFHRKNLVQQCLESKDNQAYLKTLKKLKQMMADYQNTQQLDNIDKYREEKNMKNSSIENVNRQINKCWKKIDQIKQQQKKDLEWLQNYLKNQTPIQQQDNCEQILFRIILIYKKQTSIYEVINSNLRLSISVNEQQIQCLSVIIKYLFQAIQQFFFKYKNQFKFQGVSEAVKNIPLLQTLLKSISDKTQFLYRGFKISLQELKSLKTGSIVRNLGFLSTTRSFKVAKEFQRKDYLLLLLMGPYYKQTDNDQEGFIDLQLLHKQRKQEQKNPQEQVLFNPLNIFEVLYVNSDQKMVVIKYAPHIELYNAIIKGTATQKERQKYQMIKSNISSLNRSNYDKGKSLLLKGSKKQALQYYENAEMVGETLTASQKFTKIQILKQNKNFSQIQQDLAKMAKDYESQAKQIQNLDNQVSQSTKIQKMNKILNLTKQSQFLQSTTKFFQAENRAKLANDSSKALAAQKVQHLTSSLFLQTIILDVKSTLELAKSRYQTNDIGNSIWDSLTGFKNIDRIYQHYEQYIIPKIQKICKSLETTSELGEMKNLIQIIKMDQKKPGDQNNIKIQLNRFKRQTQQIQQLRKTNTKLLMSSTYQRLKNNQYEQIKQYFAGRKKFETMFKIFYPACEQIQKLDNLIRKKQNTINLAKKSLGQFKQNMDVLFEYEQQLYDIMKLNLKVTNADIKPCLSDQKNNFYSRFQQFKNFKQKLNKYISGEINTKFIRSLNRYASFLLEFCDLEQKQEEKKAMKKAGLDILQALNSGVRNAQIRYSQSPVTLTCQKTLIINTQISLYRNNCMELDIIQKSAVMLKSSNAQPIKTISACKSRTDFNMLKKKLEDLQRIHESDTQINRFQHVLQDINSQLDMLNNSFSICQSTAEYNQFLAEANKKIEFFNQKYIKNAKIIVNQTYIEYKYLMAQNKLRRGYFKQAYNILTEAQNKLQQIYSNQKLGQKRIEKQINKLYARDLPIKCYRLKAEIVGVYGNDDNKIKALEEFDRINDLIKKQAPNKIVASALIHEAYVFVAMRSPLKMNKNINQKITKKITQSLDESILLRQGLLGTQNQFLAIAYSYYVKIDREKKEKNQIKKHYEKGRIIFDNLSVPISSTLKETYLDKEPMLYFYKMQMQVSYLQSQQKNNQEIAICYNQNIDKFIQNRHGTMSLQITKKFLTAGIFLSSLKIHKIKAEQYLKKSQQQIQQLGNINHLSKDKQSEQILKLIQKSKYNIFRSLADHYQRYGDDKNKEKYRQLADQNNPQPQNQQMQSIPIRNRSQSRNRRPKSFGQFTFQLLMGCLK